MLSTERATSSPEPSGSERSVSDRGGGRETGQAAVMATLLAGD
jgi:hypothetical protein